MKLRFPKFLIKATGEIKFSPYPLWVQYKPQMHRVRGPDVRRILDTVRPGDILLRRFDGYLNTVFTPGYFSHAGLYVGDNQIVHAVSQGTISEDILNFCRADAICVLSMVNEPFETITLAIERAKAAADANIDYDFDFSGSNETYYCTELVDVAYGGLFVGDYIEKLGQLILMPDGIRYSKRVSVRLEIKP